MTLSDTAIIRQSPPGRVIPHNMPPQHASMSQVSAPARTLAVYGGWSAATLAGSLPLARQNCEAVSGATQIPAYKVLFWHLPLAPSEVQDACSTSTSTSLVFRQVLVGNQYNVLPGDRIPLFCRGAYAVQTPETHQYRNMDDGRRVPRARCCTHAWSSTPSRLGGT